MEDSDKADPAEMLPGKFGKRLGRRFEKHVIDDLAVSQGKGFELVRQGKDDMEIRDREELPSSCLDPLLFPEELALRTMPVPARVVGYLHVAALLALVHVPPIGRPANLYCMHDAEPVQGELMGFSVRGAVAAEDIGHFRHEGLTLDRGG